MINLLCKKNAALLAAAAICLGSAGSAMGAIFLGSSGDLAASVSFDVSENGKLTVTLANNGADVLVPSDVLTAVFFDINGGADLTAAAVCGEHDEEPAEADESPGNMIFDFQLTRELKLRLVPDVDGRTRDWRENRENKRK